MKGGDTWELVLKGASAAGIGEKLARLGQDLVPASVEDLGEGRVRLSFFVTGSEAADGEAIFDWAVSENLKILQMNRKKVSLEDIFVRLTKDQSAGEERNNEPPAGEGVSA
jgi:ABC-2 type transport system ATP-binding protein